MTILFDKFILYFMFLSVLFFNLSSLSFASERDKLNFDDYEVTEEVKKPFQNVSLPDVLTSNDIESLKSGELVIGKTHMEVHDIDVFKKQTRPGVLSYIFPTLRNRSAQLKVSHAHDIKDLSTFEAWYEIPPNICFMVTGWDETVREIDKKYVVKVTDIEDDMEDVCFRNSMGSIKEIPMQWDGFQVEDALLQNMQLIHSDICSSADITKYERPISILLNNSMYLVSLLARKGIEQAKFAAKSIYNMLDFTTATFKMPTNTHLLFHVLRSSRYSLSLIDRGAPHNIIASNAEFFALFNPYIYTFYTLLDMYAKHRGYPTAIHYCLNLKKMSYEQRKEFTSFKYKILKSIEYTINFGALAPFVKGSYLLEVLNFSKVLSSQTLSHFLRGISTKSIGF